MKKQLLTSMISAAVMAGAMAVPSVAVAEDGFSANVAMTTDYRFRGISQNDEDFAIQGGFDYAHDSGFYVGIWASNVDFQIQTVDDASAEVDIYAGFANELGNGISYDVGVLTYQYPNADSSLDYDFTEVYGSLSYNWTEALSTTASIAYTSDYFGGSDDATYFSVAADYDLGDDWTVGGSVGHQSVKENTTWGTPDWNDYKAYVGKSFKGFDFEVALIDTDLSKSECFGGSDWCDSTVTFTVAKSFE
ncbi:MAG: TorF family putative porin [Gammaproteobacteria bacterium]|nr:TorF family putative porin [Gammaproteobacteria bacterium]